MATFQNPVYPFSCPDPFVLKYLGEYWCYSTGFSRDGGVFPILRSTDLVHWQESGSAMRPLDGGFTQYWAPEVDYNNGTFYLYYAVGDGSQMHLRAATSDSPGGPFTDSGRRLTREDFAIDAHVFTDEDGSRYLFYAADFLDVPCVGTGTVVDALVDPLKPQGSPRRVTLAKYDWQIFDPVRLEKGGVRWHTVEGPFVLKHNGRYYQMFSGGNWQNASYGVCYAVAEQPNPPAEWKQACDGEQSKPVLRSIREKGIIGPGHNSVVRGLDNRELFIVYHRWSETVNSRVMAIDRMGWEGERLVVHGPTAEPQPAPAQPDLAGFEQFTFEGVQLMDQGPRVRINAEDAPVSARLPLPDAFILEVSFRAPGLDRQGDISLSIDGLEHKENSVLLRSKDGRVAPGPLHGPAVSGLEGNFDPSVFHLLRVEMVNNASTWWVDGVRVAAFEHDPQSPRQLAIRCLNVESEWAAFALTKQV